MAVTDAEVAHAAAAVQKGVSRQDFERMSLRLEVGATLSREKLLSRLVDLGYEAAAEVDALGQFSARGGIVDVEFIVQYLILAHAADCPALMDNTGNIALLETAAEHDLIDPALAGRARHYRACQHDTKLRDTAVAENDEELAAHYQTVRELWRQVFGEEAGG